MQLYHAPFKILATSLTSLHRVDFWQFNLLSVHRTPLNSFKLVALVVNNRIHSRWLNQRGSGILDNAWNYCGAGGTAGISFSRKQAWSQAKHQTVLCGCHLGISWAGDLFGLTAPASTSIPSQEGNPAAIWFSTCQNRRCEQRSTLKVSFCVAAVTWLHVHNLTLKEPWNLTLGFHAEEGLALWEISLNREKFVQSWREAITA